MQITCLKTVYLSIISLAGAHTTFLKDVSKHFFPNFFSLPLFVSYASVMSVS